MDRPPHQHRVAEWAALVGERVPDVESPRDADGRAYDVAEDAPGDEAR